MGLDQGIALRFLFAGYAVIWIVLFAYVFALGFRQKRLEAEVELLRGALARRKDR